MSSTKSSTTNNKVKILVLGPAKCGKSTITNFLCQTRETPTSKYYPTRPLRILETELELEASKLAPAGDQANKNKRLVFAGGDSKVRRVQVQCWDLSGSPQYQQTWPAVAEGADGIVLLYNSQIPNAARELSLWYKHFVLNQNEIDGQGNFAKRVPLSQVLVLAHQSTQPSGDLPEDDEDELSRNPAAYLKKKLPKELESVRVLRSSLDYDSDNFKEAFDQLVQRIIVHRMEVEEEEMLRGEREDKNNRIL
ncbi:Rab family, other [Strigomonas culicis]|uniref:Rab family, other n=1 Tax=Strigomonas culicis TaxID=28005 RepID=S9UHK4_9TRYP|nr:Rab family, other [Strigomonas culicis]EPY30307.1 Rab family, other [Strigomonas culicis]|eukprot:EPY25660.1 Rab family, other [Strigomonas culicis]